LKHFVVVVSSPPLLLTSFTNISNKFKKWTAHMFRATARGNYALAVSHLLMFPKRLGLQKGNIGIQYGALISGAHRSLNKAPIG
jgi:hypothetical protein